MAAILVKDLTPSALQANNIVSACFAWFLNQPVKQTAAYGCLEGVLFGVNLSFYLKEIMKITFF